METIEYDKGGRILPNKKLLLALYSLRYNLRDNNGVVFAGKQDYEILNIIIEDVKSNIIGGLD